MRRRSNTWICFSSLLFLTVSSPSSGRFHGEEDESPYHLTEGGLADVLRKPMNGCLEPLMQNTDGSFLFSKAPANNASVLPSPQAAPIISAALISSARIRS